MYSINEYNKFVLKEADYDGDTPWHQFVRPKLDPIGSPVKAVRPSLKRYFSGVLGYQEPHFSGSFYLESEKDFSEMINFALLTRDKLEQNKEMEQGLLEAELDNIKKITLLTGNNGSPHLEPGGLKTHWDEIPKCLDVLSDFLMNLVSQSTYDMENLTTGRGTNHGWPTYLPGMSPLNSVDMLIHVRLSIMLMEEYEGDLDEFELYLKKNTNISEPCSSTMYFRKQGISKPVHSYEFSEAGPTYKFSETGKWPRHRQVFGVPLFINSALRRAANKIKYGYRQLPNFNHTTPENTLTFLLSFDNFVWFSEDISGYDKSVAYELQMAVAEKIYSRFMTPEELRLYKRLQTLNVLSPPLQKGKEAFLYSREGQTISGSMMTDKDGTIFNFARIVDGVCAATGWSESATLKRLNVDWSCLVFGDDCAIGYSRKINFDKAKYEDRSKKLNFKTVGFDGVIFLMNYYNLKKGVWHGLISRAIDKTYNKEYIVDDKIVGIFGDYHRWSRNVKHPEWDRFWKFIKEKRPVANLGLRNISDLQKIISHPTIIKHIDEYGKEASKVSGVRDMLAGLTHGTLQTDGIANTPLDILEFQGIEKLLLGITEDKSKVSLDRAKDLHESVVLDYINWSQLGAGKPPGLGDFGVKS